MRERLDFYNLDQLERIAAQEGTRLGVQFVNGAATHLAQGSRGTPRLLLNLLGRARDLAILEGKSKTAVSIDSAMTEKALASQGIDSSGLCKTDRKILRTLISIGKPIGLRTIADLVGENMKTLSEVYEPFLLREGFLIRTHFGRVATEKAKALLGI